MSANQGAVGYLHLPPGSAPPDLLTEPYKAVVIVEAAHTAEWRYQVSQWLVATGCRYMMAWGVECDAWDDSVDWAFLEATGYEVDVSGTDESFVMTTWHTDDSLSEVFWFAGYCAVHPAQDLELMLIDIGPKPREAAMRAAYLAAQIEDPDEP